MKKVLAICLVMMFVVCMGATVSAAGFISSPSTSAAPVLVSFECLTEGCTGTLVLTGYADKANLPAESAAQLDAAYASIAGGLFGDKELAVSNLFDLSVEGCSNHADHEIKVVLAVEALNRFDSLLHMNAAGEWENIDAKVIDGGKNLEFTVSDLSPFAIVVDTSEAGGDSPATGDNVMVYAVATIVVAAALAIVTVSSKKRA